MLILPVLDLKQGLVVRGVAGRRKEYRPVESRIAADARPTTVAAAFVERLALYETYVADLDAIGGAEPDWEAYHAIAGSGLRLWVDAGATESDRAERLARFSHDGQPLARIIAGLESLDGPGRLAEIVAAVGPERTVFSLDLKQGQPLLSATARGWTGMSAQEIAGAAAECGVRSLIVLDLARVGVGSGVGTEELCRAIHDRWPAVELIGGGGVRSVDDLRSLHAAGCRAALVASALHDERLTAADLKQVADW